MFVRRPSVIALQGEIANHPQTAAVKSRGGKRCGTRRAIERVRCDPMKANESKPQVTCRNALDDIETKLALLAWDEPGECLLIGQAVSGMNAARAWVRLLRGTWEPVVSWDGRPVVFDLRPGVQGRVPRGRNREGQAPDARHRVGPADSSDEGPVMGLERSGRTIQTRVLGNRDAVVVGGTNG
jgi:hypothetical protein